MKKILCLWMVAVLLCLTACAPDLPTTDHTSSNIAQNQDPLPQELPEEPELPQEEPNPRQETVDALMAQMTLEEKVGQLFFVRCPESDAVADISTYHLGGYLLFGRDFQNKTAQSVIDTIKSYQDTAKIPLLIGVDEEGGTVRRVSGNSALWPRKFQSPQKVYAQGGMEGVIADTAEKCEMLNTYGINVNFAPVADVSTDPVDFIYDRSFGRDAHATSQYVSTVVETMENGGIGSVLKHFPGYGSNVDTHTGIAVDERPYETFTASDFLPFSAGIAAGADSVLVSHNIVTAMDGSLPASLSPEVHRSLREELGFEGVILTDDLAMDAVAAYAADGSVAVLAVLAGNDMVVTTDYRTQIPLVSQAVEDGSIPRELLDSAVSRVLGWKYDLGLLNTTETEQETHYD